jgi:hypothetical protein
MAFALSFLIGEYVRVLPGCGRNADYYPSFVLGETAEKPFQNALPGEIFVYF